MTPSCKFYLALFVASKCAAFSTFRYRPRLTSPSRRTFEHLICGVEPVEALVRQGISSGVNKGFPLLLASGDALPFADNSFDAVCEFGILHHVPDPARVVKEMLRVARNVIVISDANRFGQGFLPLRILKLLLFKLKL
jgi:SAM-dependent methyltransferase